MSSSTSSGSDAEPGAETRRGRGRPRIPGAERRILDAALEEYGERGWAGFTMDGVARRAGVGKSTVYLRWRDKDSLLTDAVTDRGEGLDQVDTGSLRGDLEELTRNLFRHYLDPFGWATLRIAVDSAGSPEPLGRFTDAVRGLHREGLEAIFERAEARGEVPAGFDPALLIHCLYGAVTIQTLMLVGEDRRLDDADVADRSAALVDYLLAAIRPPAG